MANSPRSLRNIDLNLLTVFRVIDETRHITEAAKRLGLTQPALSHALNRLRTLFDDPLFVKSSRGMVPTPRAARLSAPVREWLEKVENEILREDGFDPARIDRLFVIRTTDLAEALFFPKLLAYLEKHAPRVRLQARIAPFALPREELERGECDLAIAGFFGELPGGFYQQKLYTDEFLCAVRKDHPRIKRAPSLDSYLAERHLLIAPGGDTTGKIDQELKKQKQTRFIAAGSSGFMVAGWLTALSDCIITAPARLIAEWEKALPLRSFPSPVKLAGITVVQTWHERNHQDPAHRWLRELIRSMAPD